MLTAKLISTCLGIGYIQKGAGTIAALFYCILWFLWARGISVFETLLLIALFLVVGVWSASKVESLWGEDSNKVVIDEWLGMSISLLALPLTLPYVALAFILFRFFDIAKPLGVRRAEALPGGWGVMADDVLAGIYANLLLQVVFAMELL